MEIQKRWAMALLAALGLAACFAAFPGDGASTSVEQIPSRPARVYRRGDPGVIVPELGIRVVNLKGEARKAGVDMVGSVRLVLDLKGRPQSVMLLQSFGYGTDEQVLKKVRKWKFPPCRLDGRPVSCEMKVSIKILRPEPASSYGNPFDSE